MKWGTDLIIQKPEPTTPEQGKEIKGNSLLEAPKSLEQSGNRIYFYSEIDRTSILTLNKSLRNLSNENYVDMKNKEMKEPYPIFLNIMSNGGSIFAGLAGMDEILAIRDKIPIITVIDGCCASAATFLSIVGSQRIIKPNSYMLIHQLSSMYWGKYEELKDEMVNLNRFMKKIKEIYLKYTKVPEKELEEILKHDIWVEPKQCLKWGLVDKISE